MRWLLYTLAATSLALGAGCAPKPPQVVERVVTVPVTERCAPTEGPKVVKVPRPTVVGGLVAYKPEDAAKLWSNVKALQEWIARVRSMCAGKDH